MAAIDRRIVHTHRWRHMSRRELLTLAPATLLAGAALSRHADSAIRDGLTLSDRAGEWLHRPSHQAPTYADSELTPLDRFPVNRYSEFEPTAADLVKWRLYVEGDVANPAEFTLDQVRLLPKVTQNVRHICIEGWDVIGNFAGARLSDLLAMAGANRSARYLEIACLDDYYSSIDMASALHPQSLVCYEMYGQPLTAGHGAPLRLHLPVKMGYKSSKHIYSIKVTNVLSAQRGFWEDQGYSWYGGI